jgi:hypothetical protein
MPRIPLPQSGRSVTTQLSKALLLVSQQRAGLHLIASRTLSRTARHD